MHLAGLPEHAAGRRTRKPQDHHTGRVQVIFDRDQSLLEVAQEAAHVADDEHVEGARLRRGDHRFPGRSPPGGRPARRSNGPLEATLGETVSGNGAVLLFKLGIGPNGDTQEPTPPAPRWGLRGHYSVILCTSSQ